MFYNDFSPFLVACSGTPSKDDPMQSVNEFIKIIPEDAKEYFNNPKKYVTQLEKLRADYQDHPEELYKAVNLEGLMGENSRNFPLGIGLMGIGIFIAFFGRKMIRLFISLSGFIVGSSLFLYGIVWAENIFHDGSSAPAWVFWVSGLIGGLLGSFLFYHAWKFGTYVFSAYGCAMLSLALLHFVPDEYKAQINRTAVYVIAAIIGLIATRYIEEFVLIASSSLTGGFVFFVGIDFISSVGFRAFIKNAIVDKSKLGINDIWIHFSKKDDITICLIGVMVITLSGIFVQYSKKKSQSLE